MITFWALCFPYQRCWQLDFVGFCVVLRERHGHRTIFSRGGRYNIDSKSYDIKVQLAVMTTSVNEGMRHFEAWDTCVGSWTKGDDMGNDLWLGIALHNLFYFKRCNTVKTPVRDRQNATSDFAGTWTRKGTRECIWQWEGGQGCPLLCSSQGALRASKLLSQGLPCTRGLKG